MRQRTVSGEIDTIDVDAVRLKPRDDEPTLPLPRAWPRATRELTSEIATETENLRTTIWCAVGGLLVVISLYLVF